MITKRLSHVLVIALAAVVIGIAGCARDESTLEPAPYPTDGEVFTEGFGARVDYQAFGASKVDALSIVSGVAYNGDRALRAIVPSAGDPSGAFAGGAFTSGVGRDLTGYDALTFWARASMPATLNEVGFGNDNTGTSRYIALQSGIPISTVWKKYVLPIPLPEKLTQERGLFFFAEGAENGAGYEILFDDIQYEKLGTLARPRASMKNLSLSGEVGDVFAVEGTTVTYDVSGSDVSIQASPGYFTFASSNDAVATVTGDGVITAVGTGKATISAKLGTASASGAVTVDIGGAALKPTQPAPVPAHPAANVVSIFSNAYPSASIDTWSADWDNADVADFRLAGDDMKKYTNLVFAGIEFISQPVDASAMTHFHIDIWTPDPTSPPAVFNIKLVDFGADGVYGGGNDVEHELSFTRSSTPPLATGSWVSFDIPLSSFTRLATRAHLTQLIISGNIKTVYVDNVYFHR